MTQGTGSLPGAESPDGLGSPPARVRGKGSGAPATPAAFPRASVFLHASDGLLGLECDLQRTKLRLDGGVVG